MAQLEHGNKDLNGKCYTPIVVLLCEDETLELSGAAPSTEYEVIIFDPASERSYKQTATSNGAGLLSIELPEPYTALDPHREYQLTLIWETTEDEVTTTHRDYKVFIVRPKPTDITPPEE